MNERLNLLATQKNPLTHSMLRTDILYLSLVFSNLPVMSRCYLSFEYDSVFIVRIRV